jgi:uncharacterized protein (TIGR00290 family)
MSGMPTILCWSGGKDAAYALHLLRQGGVYNVQYLMCTLHAETRLVNMHGLHESIVEAQAIAIGLPLIKMEVHNYSNEEYEQQLAACLLPMASRGITHIAFGDIFLEDLKQFREKQQHLLGLSAVFPLWQMNTDRLIKEILSIGFKSVICCVNTSRLDQKWLGRFINHAFIASLPPGTDACGENGEYHSCCVAGPIFETELTLKAGPVITQLPGDEQKMFSGFEWIRLELS